MKSVYSAVRTGSLNKAVCASSLKGFNIIFPFALRSSSDSFNSSLQNKPRSDVISLTWSLQVLSKQHDLECSKIVWKKGVSWKDKMNEDAVLWYQNFDSFLCQIRIHNIKASEVSNHISTSIAPFCCCCFNLYKRQNSTVCISLIIISFLHNLNDRG
jgi:hypothetical protein